MPLPGADDSSSSPAVANLVSAVTDGGGFNLEIEVPLGKREIDISDKVKGEAEGTANGKAKVDGGGAATVTLDKNGWGVKVTEAIWSSKAKAQLGGVDLFANPKFEEESAANANERSFKVSFSVETPLGKLAVAAIPFKISGTESKLGAIEGSLEGKPAQFGEAEVEGVKFSDIELCFTFKFTVSPDWAKIIAEQLKKRALNAAEDAAGDAAIDLAIDGGLIFVAIGVIAGTANELSKASDQRQLIGTVAYCYNRFTDGLHKGLTGEPTPGDPWGDAGWKPGNKMYSDAVNKALQADPNAVIDEIQANVANKARKIASSMDGQIKTKIGDQFWKRWVAANHGVGTFLGDAKSACATCYGEAMVADNDPRLNDWKEASSLPGFLK